MDSIYEVKRANRQAGKHFFDADTMRFFKSRVSNDVEPLPNGAALFITSEQFEMADRSYRAPRKYTIRLALPDGDIVEVGKFQAFNSGINILD